MWPKDDDLEHIFKEGSSRHEYPYDPIAWGKMSMLLDRRRRRRLILWWSSGILGMILLYTGIMLMSDRTIHNEAQIELLSSEHDQFEENASIINSNSNTIINLESLTVSSNGNINKPPSVTHDHSKKATVINSNISFNTNRIEKIRQSEVNKTSTSDVLDNNTDFHILANKWPSQSRADIINIYSPLLISKLAIVYFVIPEINLPHPSLVLSSQKRDVSYSRLLISTFLGAETSWTPHGEFSSIDLSIGIKGGYNLSDKIAISVGANYRTDTYIAGHSDYKPVKGFWENGIAPTYIDANCKMIEISTGFSYAFNTHHKNGFIVSGLFVSNMMLKESYDYKFEDLTNNFESSWSGSNNTLFSNLELGIGYRRQLNNGNSIEFTPYSKIPISGIGHGNLMLSSFGLRLTYNLGI